jgi:hypothetical protein
MGNINQKTKKSMVIFLENFDTVLCTHKSCLCGSFDDIFECSDWFTWKPIPVKLKDNKVGMYKVAYARDVTIKNSTECFMNLVLIKTDKGGRTILMTNKPINSFDEAQHIYYKYLQRWKIETTQILFVCF